MTRPSSWMFVDIRERPSEPKSHEGLTSRCVCGGSVFLLPLLSNDLTTVHITAMASSGATDLSPDSPLDLSMSTLNCENIKEWVASSEDLLFSNFLMYNSRTYICGANVRVFIYSITHVYMSQTRSLFCVSSFPKKIIYPLIESVSLRFIFYRIYLCIL